MDLGAHTFNTSTEWFMRMYPVDFDEVRNSKTQEYLYGFETEFYD
jgi:hypothetical protein